MIKQNNIDFITYGIISLCLPPILSCFLLILLYLRSNNKNIIIIFSLFLSLLLTYNFFSIDNYGRFTHATSAFYDSWYLGDPLTNLMRLGIQTLPLECSHFFLLYTFTALTLWWKTLTNCVLIKNKNIYIYIFLIFILVPSIRNIMDLSYYCLSLLFTLYLTSKSNQFTLVKYGVLIIGVYLIHPGFLIILLPAIPIYIFSKSSNIYYYSILFLVFTLYALLSNATLTHVGILLIDVVIEAFSSYTQDGFWGIREGATAIKGISYTLIYYIIPFLYFILFLYTIKYRSFIKQKFILAIFQASILFYPNFIKYVTLSERVLLVLSFTSILCWIMLIQTNKFKMKLKSVIIYSSLIFTFNITKASGAVLLPNVFKENTYIEKQYNSLYLPSIFLFDFQTYGYSDNFLKENTYITF